MTVYSSVVTSTRYWLFNVVVVFVVVVACNIVCCSTNVSKMRNSCATSC